MSDLGGISGKAAVRAFTHLGYVVVRQRGSHVRLRDRTGQRPKITVPLHKELAIGLLRQLLKDTHVSVEQFLEVL